MTDSNIPAAAARVHLALARRRKSPRHARCKSCFPHREKHHANQHVNPSVADAATAEGNRTANSVGPSIRTDAAIAQYVRGGLVRCGRSCQ